MTGRFLQNAVAISIGQFQNECPIFDGFDLFFPIFVQHGKPLFLSFAAFSKLAQFRTVLVGGATRQPMAGEVNGIIEAAGFPPIELYNRSTKSGLVLPKEYIYFLPEPTDPSNPDGTSLGATFWGETVTAASPEFSIPDSEQPGLVVGVYREDRIPYEVEVQSDAIVLPVARDANKSMAVKVL